jgi:protein O-mannosyl-transferase
MRLSQTISRQFFSKADSGLPAFFLIALLIWIGYHDVLMDFFVGDDFVHLEWLNRAAKHPELVFRNFYSNWLDIPTTLFYRPLISVSLMADYLLWQKNGLGFHISNLAWHCLACCGLYRLTEAISPNNSHAKSRNIWPLTAACLFAVYPLNPEVVSWITGRVDSISTAFILWSIVCYVKGRQSQNHHLKFATAILMIMALMSKETAIILPMIFLAFELIYPLKTNACNSFFSKVFTIGKSTLPFFILLAAYFFFRRFALGSFLGGYDNSFELMHPGAEQICIWQSSFWKWLVPINESLRHSGNFFQKSWTTLIFVSIILLCIRIAHEKQLFRPLFFLILLAAFSFIPAYKLFSIAWDLQGSRTGYLAAAPLCALLTLGSAATASAVANGLIKKTVRLFGVLCALALCFSALMLLRFNNQAWHEAALESNALQSAFHQLIERTDKRTFLVFCGLPDNVHGAYVCRNALGGITGGKKTNIQEIGQDTTAPIGYLKDSILKESKTNKIVFFQWRGAAIGFRRMRFWQAVHSDAIEKWNALSLKEKCEAHFEGPIPHINLKLPPLPGWYMDFIEIRLRPNQQQGDWSFINFANTYYNKGLFQIRYDNPERIILPLHSQIDWITGGIIKNISVTLPDNVGAKLLSVRLVKPYEIMPKLDVPGLNFIKNHGTLVLSKNLPNAPLSVSVSGIEAAENSLIEITKASRLFDCKNATVDSQSAILKLITLSGQTVRLELKHSDFPASGWYQLRVWALNKEGKRIGVAGDHINVQVID